jgi:hypothetical protein
MQLVEADRTDAAKQARDHAAEVRASAVQRTRKSASDLSRVLDRTARTLEQSARLAEVHSQREHRAGRLDVASEERRAALRAAEAAGRARLLAAQFDALAAGRTAPPQEQQPA